MDNVPGNDGEINETTCVDPDALLLFWALETLEYWIRCAAVARAGTLQGTFADVRAAAGAVDAIKAYCGAALVLSESAGDDDTGWVREAAERAGLYAASAQRYFALISGGDAANDAAASPNASDAVVLADALEFVEEFTPDDEDPRSVRRRQSEALREVEAYARGIGKEGARAMFVLLHVAALIEASPLENFDPDALPDLRGDGLRSMLAGGPCDGAALVNRALRLFGIDPRVFGATDRKVSSRADGCGAKFRAADDAGRRRMVRQALKAGASDSSARMKLGKRGVAADLAGRWGVPTEVVRALYPDPPAAPDVIAPTKRKGASRRG